jgi:hypothetical protein
MEVCSPELRPPSQVAAAADEAISTRQFLFGRALSAFSKELARYQLECRFSVQAAVRCRPAELRCGGDILRGRAHLRALLQQQTRGWPSLQVSPVARWTLNALAAGYARAVTRQGMVSEEANDGRYQ